MQSPTRRSTVGTAADGVYIAEPAAPSAVTFWPLPPPNPSTSAPARLRWRVAARLHDLSLPPAAAAAAADCALYELANCAGPIFFICSDH